MMHHSVIKMKKANWIVTLKMQEILSNNTQNKIIIITGATSGIGYALSEIYLKIIGLS